MFTKAIYTNRIVQQLTKGILLLCFFALCTACDKDEATKSPQKTGERVYLTFSLGNVNTTPSSTTRNSKPTINTDGTFFEDRVRDLVIYIYDSQTGINPDLGFRAYGGLPLNGSVSFVVDFPEGTYDFYFIANMPTKGENSSSSLTNRDEANAYLNKLIPLDKSLFTGPIKDGQDLPLFPMARVYKNQVIKKNSSNSTGSSAQNPIYFRPINEDGVAEEHILLNRSVGKIETILKGEGAKNVTSVKLINGVNEYSLTTRTDNSGKTPNTANNTLKPRTNSSVLYTPEVIQTATPKWIENYTGKDINYLLLTLKSGYTYKVPVVSNYTGGNYLEFAQTDAAKFNVLRNNHYRFTLNIQDNEIGVNVKVLPWTVAESTMDFGKAEYTFNLVNPNKENEQTILLHQQEQLKVQFKLSKPTGALWKATITNGLAFKLTPIEGDLGAVGGIADDQKTWEFYIQPTGPYEGTNRFTELYITVDEKEVQLIEGSSEKPEPGKRYVFKQVE